MYEVHTTTILTILLLLCKVFVYPFKVLLIATNAVSIQWEGILHGLDVKCDLLNLIEIANLSNNQ